MGGLQVSPTPLFLPISTHLHTERALDTKPSRLPVPLGRHHGHCLLVTAPSAHHTTPHHTTPHHTTPHHTTPHHTTPHHTTPHYTWMAELDGLGAGMGWMNHTWLSSYVGPRASQVQSSLWDPMVLEQWSAAIAAPSMQAAHMGLAGGTYGAGRAARHGARAHLASRQNRRRFGWPTPKHAMTSSRPAWGPIATIAWALQELQQHQQAERQGIPRAALN